MIFHLAIPAKDIVESMYFYEHLGGKMGRMYETSLVMELFGAQVVLHKSLDYAMDPKMYPRHFGVIVSSVEGMNLWNKWKYSTSVFQSLFQRLKGESGEHWTFFLKDPSNNLIEFKWYKNPDMVFGK